MMELVVVVVAVVEEQEMEDLVEGLALEVDRWLEEELQVLVEVGEEGQEGHLEQEGRPEEEEEGEEIGGVVEEEGRDLVV